MKNRTTKYIIAVLLVVLLGLCFAACGDKDQKFTVSFDSNNGSAVAPIEVLNEGTVTAPTSPTKTGYTFAKWIKPDGTEFNFATDVVTANITLKAIWTLNNYKVTFVTDGGSAVPDQQVDYNGVATMPQPPTKTSYVFYKWYADQNFNNEYDFNSKITKETVIYGRFAKVVAETYTVDFVGSDTAIPSQQTNAMGILDNLPVPQKANSVFVGWWISDFDNPDKLTCQYVDQVISQNMKLYAVWQSTSLELSVDANGVRWASKGAGLNYKVTITPPTEAALVRTQNQTSLEYAFADKAAGEYVIEVEYNSIKTTVYYNNKALDKVSLFEVDDFVFKFNPVLNATKYLITVDCGNPQHSHVDYDNGTNTTFVFDGCDMKKEGISFVVKAVANGFVTSTSATFVLKRELAAVSGLRVDQNTQQLVWDAVPNATSYMVKIDENGTFVNSTDLKSASVGDRAPGQIKFFVYAVANGYYSPDATEYVYTKTSLQTPNTDSFSIVGKTLSWDNVEGAVKYYLQIGNQEFEATTNSLVLPESIGDMTNLSVKIQAVSSVAANNSLYSNAKTFSATLAGQVEYSKGAIRWSTILGAKNYLVKVDGGQVQTLANTVSSFAVSFDTAGTHTVAVNYIDKNDVEGAVWESQEIEIFVVTLLYNREDQGTFKRLFRAQGDDLNLPTDPTEVLTNGYTFKNWSSSANGSAYNVTVLEEATNLTLYALWRANKYTITFNYEGGTMSTNTFEVTYDSTFVLPVATASHLARSFAGWYTEPNGGGVAYSDEEGYNGSPWRLAQNTTLYAYWVEVFTFNLINNGTAYSVSKGAGISHVHTVTIPVSYENLPVTTIETNAFQDCTNLYVINIPDTIVNIELGINGGFYSGSAFYNCANLTDINVYDVIGLDTLLQIGESFYRSVDGVLLYHNEFTGVEIKYFPYARTGEYVVPDIVTIIPVNAFRASKITKVTIPYSVVNIGATAFSNCRQLTEVEFLLAPEGKVETELVMDTNVFLSCVAMTKITLPSRMLTFNVDIFDYCSALENITIIGTGGNYSSKNGIICNETGDTLIYCPSGKTGEFVVPNGISVLGEKCFPTNVQITSLVIPRFVTEIQTLALTYNSSIRNIIFEGQQGDAPLVIRESAFYGCQYIEEVVLPDNLLTLEEYVFGNCARLVKVTVNSRGTLDFKTAAFSSVPTSNNTGRYTVTTLHLGAGVESFDINGVFGDKLTAVTVDDANPFFETDDNVLYKKGKTEIVFISRSRDGVFTFPATVTRVGDAVFRDRVLLTGITISANIEEIGYQAFYGCIRLTSVTFAPNGKLTTIGDYAFANCSSLETITLPKTVTKMGEYNANDELVQNLVFDNCTKLQTINVDEDSTTYMNDNGILYGITINAQNQKVKTDLFACPCDIEVTNNILTIPNTVTKVWTKAFNLNNNLVKIVFEEVELEGGQTTYPAVAIDANTFERCDALQEVILPKGLLELPANTFYMCMDLTKVFVPNTVTTIRGPVFSNCSALSDIVFEDNGTAPLEFLTTTAAGGGSSEGAVGSVVGTFNNLKKIGKMVLPNRTTNICEGMFYGSGVTEVVIPASVTSIAKNAFYNCINLTRVTIIDTAETPSQLTSVGDYAFQTTTALKAVVLGTEDTVTPLQQPVRFPTGITSFGLSAFNGSGIESIVIPARLSTVKNMVFNNSFLKEVIFETAPINESAPATSSLTQIGTSWFQYCKDLTSVVLPSSIKTIGSSAFYGCEKLASVTLNEGLTTINASAFRQCYALGGPTGEFVIPSTVATIGGTCFMDCTNLKTITFATNASGFSALGNLQASAFQNSGLTSFTFPTRASGNITLGNTLFTGCRSLTDLHLSKSITANIGAALNKAPAIRNITVAPDSANFSLHSSLPMLLNKAGNAILYVFGPLTGENSTFVVPAGDNEIGVGAFKNQVDLVKIFIPDTVKTIGENAFLNCYLLQEVVFYKTIVNPETNKPEAVMDGDKFVPATQSALTSIGISAFACCKSLKDISILEGVTTLSNYAFYDCESLTSVTIPSTVKTFGNYVFAYCYGLTTATVNTNLKQAGSAIGTYLFGYCSSLQTVTLASDLSKVGQYMFYSCQQLVDIVLPDSVTNYQASVLSGTGITSYVIPSSVSNIGNYAFRYCYDLTSVTFESGSTITTFGMGAFSTCSSLATVNFAQNQGDVISGVKALGNNMFEYCTSLKQIDLSPLSQLWFLGTSTFRYSGLNSITIPETVVHIGTAANRAPAATAAAYVFADCEELTEVTLSSALQNIGGYTFSNCKKLTNVKYTGYTGDKDVVLPDSVTLLGSYVFQYAAIESIDASNVATYGQYVFKGCANLSDIKLKDGLTTINNYMFNECTSLRHIELPESVSTINQGAFYNSGLEEFDFTQNITTLSNFAFAGTNLVSVDMTNIGLNELVTVSGASAVGLTNLFNGCDKLVSVKFKDTFTDLGQYMFANCTSLTSITLPSKLASLGGFTFLNTGLTEITIPFYVTKFGRLEASSSGFGMSANASYTFQDCKNLTKINILSDTFEGFGPGAFKGCESLTEFVIPDTVTFIDKDVFYGTGISTINIPASVEIIMGTSFGACNKLTHFTVDPKNEFYTVNEDGVLHSKTGELVSYPGGKTTLDIDGVTSISISAFEGNTSLKDITIPASVTSIGNYAFRNSKLTSVSFEANSQLKSIGQYAFQNCTLTSIELPASLKQLGNYVFHGSKLAEVTFAANGQLTDIGMYCFTDTALTSIVIPETVVVSPSASLMYAFRGCEELTTVTINSDMDLANYMFADCTKLTTVNFNGDTTKIGNSTFLNCTSLKAINLPDSLVTIDISAFEGSGLVNISIPASVRTISQYAFRYCSALTTVTFAESNELLTIGGSATMGNTFTGCTALTTITIPQNVYLSATKIFAGWTSAQTIRIVGRTRFDIMNDWYGTDTYSIIPWDCDCAATIVWDYQA